jgi:flagellar biosynthesis regulator FlaF
MPDDPRKTLDVNSQAVNNAYDRLSRLLDDAVDMTAFLRDQAEAENRSIEADELEDTLLHLTSVVQAVGKAMSSRSVTDKRAKFRVVK